MSTEFQSSFPGHKTCFNASALLSHHDPMPSGFYNHYAIKIMHRNTICELLPTNLMPTPVSSFSPFQSILHISGILKQTSFQRFSPFLENDKRCPTIHRGKTPQLLSVAVFQSPSLCPTSARAWSQSSQHAAAPPYPVPVVTALGAFFPPGFQECPLSQIFPLKPSFITLKSQL